MGVVSDISEGVVEELGGKVGELGGKLPPQ